MAPKMKILVPPPPPSYFYNKRIYVQIKIIKGTHNA